MIFHHTQVPLGVLPKNEMKCADMIDIMKFHHQYVPGVEYEERTRCDEIGDVIVKDAVMYPFLLEVTNSLLLDREQLLK